MKRALFIASITIAIVIGLIYAQGVRHGGAGFGSGHGGASINSDPVARGGRGYDKFWIEYDVDSPDTRHASYPVEGNAKPSDTWRCKECHGWDYLGKQGAYGTGSHSTGIGGILNSQDQSVTAILDVLSSDTHGYDAVLPVEALQQIALFVSEGQIDMRPIINYENKSVSGNTMQGKTTFSNICADCHGNDGKEFNFSHDADEPEFVGTVASDNPWETLHKIRNGHPGAFVNHMTGRHTERRGMGTTFMPPMRTELTIAEQSNLLTYLQTLPER